VGSEWSAYPTRDRGTTVPVRRAAGVCARCGRARDHGPGGQLHYLAANGVEIRRQVVPANAADIAATLLAAGAGRSAKLNA